MALTHSDIYASRLPESKAGTISRRDPVVWNRPDKAKGPLQAAQLAAFEVNGFLFLKSLFSEEEMDCFSRELECLARDERRFEDPRYIVEPGSGEVRSIFEIHRNNELFKRLAHDERVVSIVQEILGSGVYIHQSRVNLKPGFKGKEFYWHSDFETWHVEDGMPRMRAVSCSITLTENYPFNGPLMVIPGSHKHYVVCEGRTPEDHYKESLKKQEYGVPDNESLQLMVKEGGIEAPVGPPGSAVFFDCNIMHGSNGNITPFPRSNVFFVYNSVENRLTDPFGAVKPRPEFIGAREYQDEVRPAKQDYFAGKEG